MEQLIGDSDRIRWVAYFDLLGVQALISSGREGTVFNAYWAAQQEFKNHSEWAPRLGHAWLSDTFLIVGDDASEDCFRAVECMSRLFFDALLRIRMPLRGAIACDRFYADFDDRAFFGRALVEAYQIGESQDWIGLVLCPSAERRLSEIPSVTAMQSYWRKVDVPWKAQKELPPLFTCLLGGWMHTNFKNPRIETLQSMQAECRDERSHNKYARTLAFLKEHDSRNG